jgi:hypothetical protein
VHIGDDPRDLAIADFNRDGHPDVVVATNTVVRAGISELDVISGSAQGPLAPAQVFELGQYQTGVVAADFNGDGAPDIAVADNGKAGVEVLLNRGDGTFGAPTTYPTGTTPYALRAADLDGDGNLDLVSVTLESANAVSILAGRGDGTFAAKKDLSLGTSADAEDLAIADMNGDGVPDLVVANGNLGSAVPAVFTFLGTGNLGFAAPTTTTVTAALGMVVGDFNEDHHLDLVVSSYLNQDLLLGNGDGTYAAPVTVPGVGEGTGLAAADFDGDGHLDLAVTSGTWFSPATGDKVAVLRGHGDGTFEAPALYEPGLGSVALGVADFNGDGRPDLVVANSTIDTLSVLASTPAGFVQPVVQPVGAGMTHMMLADLNGDGRPDLFTDGAVFMPGTGAGWLGSPVQESMTIEQFVVDDWTGDGIPDVVSAYGSGQLVAYAGQGDGTFGPQVQVPIPVTADLITKGDFDGDGHTDLLAFDRTGGDPVVLYGDGHGNVVASTAVPDSGMVSLDARAADMDGDGKDDLVLVQQYNNESLSGQTYIKVVRGAGDRTLTALPLMTPNGVVESMLIADLDGDHKLDLVTVTAPRSPAVDNATVMRGNGDGTFADGVGSTLFGNNVGRAIGADVDGDGVPELVLYGSQLAIWNISVTAPMTLRALYPYGADLAAAADLDGDGTDDIVLGRDGAKQIVMMRPACP